MRLSVGEGTSASCSFRVRMWAVPMACVVVFVVYQAIAALAFDSAGVGSAEARSQWDAHAYVWIAGHGYPPETTWNPDGAYFAFYPLFPALIRAGVLLTGLAPEPVAVAVSLGCATVAVGVLGRWLHGVGSAAAALAAVVALLAWPASPVFQLAYTEGLAVLLLVLSWMFVTKERDGWAVVCILALSLTRGLALPLCAAVATHLWTTGRLRPGHHPRGAVGVLAAAVVGVLLWPVLAGVLAGDVGVYWSSHVAFAPDGLPQSVLEAGLRHPEIAVLVVLFLAMTTILAVKLLPEWTPPVVRWWCAVYPVYLVVGSLVTPSIVRYLLLLFPLGLAAVPLARRRWAVAVAALVLVLGQVGAWWWVEEFVPLGGDWTYP
ncbi:hypothetical protein JQN72_17095 [Phycicoccus sp. CSK15P-2]|uniref:hypothetical protein n=1 Tax=Phycicoccus sp. CSK15P-2 TaxID=2807627 RepID=UPI00194E1478|nr:hypothetical protein [Phycicoccus sp. CSK15P-2]MBM6405961.1 hypothetical protein [Phycicoccus sp. CSK15P-2]